MNNIGQNIRFALRKPAQVAAFVVIAVLTLALGIGAKMDSCASLAGCPLD